MTEQDEIRYGVANIIFRDRNLDLVSKANIPLAEEILSYLHSQGVVVRVNKELPEPDEVCPLIQGRLLAYNIELRKAGFEAVESLIKEAA